MAVAKSLPTPAEVFHAPPRIPDDISPLGCGGSDTAMEMLDPRREKAQELIERCLRTSGIFEVIHDVIHGDTDKAPDLAMAILAELRSKGFLRSGFESEEAAAELVDVICFSMRRRLYMPASFSLGVLDLTSRISDQLDKRGLLVAPPITK